MIESFMELIAAIAAPFLLIGFICLMLALFTKFMCWLIDFMD